MSARRTSPTLTALNSREGRLTPLASRSNSARCHWRLPGCGACALHAMPPVIMSSECPQTSEPVGAVCLPSLACDPSHRSLSAPQSMFCFVCSPFGVLVRQEREEVERRCATPCLRRTRHVGRCAGRRRACAALPRRSRPVCEVTLRRDRVHRVRRCAMREPQVRHVPRLQKKVRATGAAHGRAAAARFVNEGLERPPQRRGERQLPHFVT